MSEPDVRVIAVALAALASGWPSNARSRAVLAALSGASIVWSSWSTTFEGRDLGWAALLVVLFAVGLVWAIPVLFGAFTSPMYTWVLFAGCLGAVHVCVPENGRTAEVGLLVACGGVAEFLMRRRLPLPVWSAIATAVLWTAVFGASGRARAVIGGLFAVTPLIATALVVRPRRAVRPLTETRRWLIAFVWLAAAWIVARTGGIAETTSAAWISVAIASGIALPVSFAVRFRTGVS